MAGRNGQRGALFPQSMHLGAWPAVPLASEGCSVQGASETPPPWPRAVVPSLGGDQGVSAASWSPKNNLKDGGHPDRRLQP